MTRKIAVIGLQVGDEGKGVRVAHYAWNAATECSDPRHGEGMPVLVERYQGGGNAGHTAVIHGKEFKLHQIPCGILIPKTFNLVGEGMYFNPRSAVEEIRELREQGVQISANNFGIASNVQVTLDHHVRADQYDFNKGGGNHTSTGRGMTPTAVDKFGKRGLRFQEFLNRDSMSAILTENQRRDGGDPDLEGIEELVDSYDEERDELACFSVLENEARKKHGSHYWIGEGAQGAMLSVDVGLYPGTTASNPIYVPNRPNVILGAVKLYTSSVGGDRPFVSQMDPELERTLRDRFGERGATTGLNRDLGWFDAVAVRYAVEKSGADFLIGNCGDRLECLYGMGEKVKLVVGYKFGCSVYDKWNESFHDRSVLREAEPIYEEFEPWEKFSEGDELTSNAYEFVNVVEERVGRNFAMFGTGPKIEDCIENRDNFNFTGWDWDH